MRRGHGLQNIEAYARTVRRTGSRRQQNPLRAQTRDLLQADLVVPCDLNLRAAHAKVLNEIVGEAVVIVDDQNHAGIVAGGVEVRVRL